MRKYDKEIDLGHGLFKYVEEKMGLMSGDITSDEDVVAVTGQSVSEIMQDELEPIWHETQHDESDDLEEAKKTEGELTEFEKSEIKGKLRIENQEQVADYTDAYWRREFYSIDSSKEEVEWKIVELDGGGFIRRPFPIKKATLTGPDRPKRPWHFLKNEKWEWKNDT